MAAAISALNAKIRSQPILNYVFSTRKFTCARYTTQLFPLALANVSIPADFWGPVSNFGIPIAAVMDTQKDPEMYASSRIPLFPWPFSPTQL